MLSSPTVPTPTLISDCKMVLFSTSFFPLLLPRLSKSQIYSNFVLEQMDNVWRSFSTYKKILTDFWVQFVGEWKIFSVKLFWIKKGLGLKFVEVYIFIGSNICRSKGEFEGKLRGNLILSHFVSQISDCNLRHKQTWIFVVPSLIILVYSLLTNKSELYNKYSVLSTLF